MATYLPNIAITKESLSKIFRIVYDISFSSIKPETFHEGVLCALIQLGSKIILLDFTTKYTYYHSIISYENEENYFI